MVRTKPTTLRPGFLSLGDLTTDMRTTEAYLRTRQDAKFDRYDFDSLSNKFLSKLVIRAN